MEFSESIQVDNEISLENSVDKYYTDAKETSINPSKDLALTNTTKVNIDNNKIINKEIVESKNTEILEKLNENKNLYNIDNLEKLMSKDMFKNYEGNYENKNLETEDLFKNSRRKGKDGNIQNNKFDINKNGSPSDLISNVNKEPKMDLINTNTLGNLNGNTVNNNNILNNIFNSNISNAPIISHNKNNSNDDFDKLDNQFDNCNTYIKQQPLKDNSRKRSALRFIQDTMGNNVNTTTNNTNNYSGSIETGNKSDYNYNSNSIFNNNNNIINGNQSNIPNTNKKQGEYESRRKNKITNLLSDLDMNINDKIISSGSGMVNNTPKKIIGYNDMSIGTNAYNKNNTNTSKKNVIFTDSRRNNQNIYNNI